MAYITVECMNPKPHAAHSWREGFLWIRKRECGGVPQDFFNNRAVSHKHKFKCVGSDGDYGCISFVCDHPIFKTCNAKLTMTRYTYESLVMRGQDFNSAYIRWSETW